MPHEFGEFNCAASGLFCPAGGEHAVCGSFEISRFDEGEGLGLGEEVINTAGEADIDEDGFAGIIEGVIDIWDMR